MVLPRADQSGAALSCFLCLSFASAGVFHWAPYSRGMVQMCGSHRVPLRACASGSAALHLHLATSRCLTTCCKFELLFMNLWYFTMVRVHGYANSQALSSSWKTVSISNMTVYQKISVMFHDAKFLLKKKSNQTILLLVNEARSINKFQSKKFNCRSSWGNKKYTFQLRTEK